MHYTGQVYRHPIEADTPLLEVTAGCSHNKCAFCVMYRETPFKLSQYEDIEADLKELKLNYGSIKRIFIVNAEPFILSTNKLIKIGELINSYFPEIETITCYTSIKSLKTKTVDDLKKLKALKYNDLHIGLESAYEPALIQMNKGCTLTEAYDGVDKLTQAGMRWDAIIMLGVAGKGKSEVHINETANFLNKFPPYLVSIMTTSVSKGTELEKMVASGEFVECSELEKIEEEKLLLNLLTFDDAYFFGGHYYNLIPINGTLDQKDSIIKHIDKQMQNIDSHILNGVLSRANI